MRIVIFLGYLPALQTQQITLCAILEEASAEPYGRISGKALLADYKPLAQMQVVSIK